MSTGLRERTEAVAARTSQAREWAEAGLSVYRFAKEALSFLCLFFGAILLAFLTYMLISFTVNLADVVNDINNPPGSSQEWNFD